MLSVPVDAVDQADADQEQKRGDQVDDDVVQARLDPRRAGAVQDQAVGGGQQHLEEDEQVEQVAGQEGAVQPHQQELEKRVESVPARSQRASENTKAARPSAAVSASISADSRSRTSTMPNSEGQSPSR